MQFMLSLMKLVFHILHTTIEGSNAEWATVLGVLLPCSLHLLPPLCGATQDAFLVELGLKDVGGEWLLSVPLCTLSVLARLLVRRLSKLETGNDMLCVDIWQR